MPFGDVEAAPREQTTIPLQPKWRDLFNKYDRNRDGRLSHRELKRIITDTQEGKQIPQHAARKILHKADVDGDGYLSYEEFEKLVMSPDFPGMFSRAFNQYVRLAVPRADAVDARGDYEEAYTCFPPRVIMLLLSILEISTFLGDLIADGSSDGTGSSARWLIYNPTRRYEAWRYLTYMLVHIGAFHLVVNVAVQVMLGVPLEMVHGGRRVLAVYLAGVVAGSLGTSITDPRVYLAGASGGVYAIMAAHIATIIMNWAEMTFPLLQLLIFLLIAGVDVGTAVYQRYVLDKHLPIGYSAHFAGALAGLLLGVNVLRNLRKRDWERKVKWVSLGIYVTLMVIAIVWNATWTDYFPKQRWD